MIYCDNAWSNLLQYVHTFSLATPWSRMETLFFYFCKVKLYLLFVGFCCCCCRLPFQSDLVLYNKANLLSTILHILKEKKIFLKIFLLNNWFVRHNAISIAKGLHEMHGYDFSSIQTVYVQNLNLLI